MKALARRILGQRPGSSISSRRLVAIASVGLAQPVADAPTVPLPSGRHRVHPRTRPLPIGERA